MDERNAYIQSLIDEDVYTDDEILDLLDKWDAERKQEKPSEVEKEKEEEVKVEKEEVKEDKKTTNLEKMKATKLWETMKTAGGYESKEDKEKRAQEEIDIEKEGKETERLKNLAIEDVARSRVKKNEEIPEEVHDFLWKNEDIELKDGTIIKDRSKGGDDLFLEMDYETELVPVLEASYPGYNFDYNLNLLGRSSITVTAPNGEIMEMLTGERETWGEHLADKTAAELEKVKLVNFVNKHGLDLEKVKEKETELFKIAEEEYNKEERDGGLKINANDKHDLDLYYLDKNSSLLSPADDDYELHQKQIDANEKFLEELYKEQNPDKLKNRSYNKLGFGQGDNIRDEAEMMLRKQLLAERITEEEGRILDKYIIDNPGAKKAMLEFYNTKSQDKTFQKAAVLQLQQEEQVENFKDNANTKIIDSVNDIITNPDKEFTIQQDDVVVKLSNGKLISEREYDEYRGAIDAQDITRQIIFDRQTEILDLSGKLQKREEQWDLLRREYDIMEKSAATVGLVLTDIGRGILTAGHKLNMMNPLVSDEHKEIMDVGYEAIAKAHQEWSHEIREGYSKDVAFEDAFSDLGTFGRFVAQEVSTQIPIIAAIAVTGPAAMPLIATWSAGQHWMDMDLEDWKPGNVNDRSEWEKGLLSAGYGASEAIFERLTTIPILSRGKKLLSGKGGPGLFNYKRQMINYFKERAPQSLVYDPILESFGEGATQITQNIIDGRPFMEGVDHAMFSGLMMGSGMGGVPFMKGLVMQSFTDHKSLTKYRERLTQITKLEASLENSTLEQEKVTVDRIFKLKRENELQLEKIEGKLSEELSTRAYNAYHSLTDQSEQFRIDAEVIINNKALSKDVKNDQLKDLKKDFDMVQRGRDMFRNTESFGNELTALKSSTSITDINEWSEIQQLAIEEVRTVKEKGPDFIPDNVDVNAKAYDIFVGRQIDSRVANAQKSTSKAVKLKMAETNDIAIDMINDSNLSEKKKNEAIEGIKEGSINGFELADGAQVVVRENAIKNERMNVSTHEPGHAVFGDLIGRDSAAFEGMSNQIQTYLKKTQPSIWQRMVARGIETDAKGNLLADEVVMNFLEEVDAGRIDFKKPANKKFAGLLGFITGKTLKDGTKGKFEIDFKGETDVINFLVGLGKKISAGTLTEVDITAMREGAVIKEVGLGAKAKVETQVKPGSKFSKSKFMKMSNEKLVEEIKSLDKDDVGRGPAIKALIEKNQGIIYGPLGLAYDVKKGDVSPERIEKAIEDELLGTYAGRGIIETFNPKEGASFSTYLGRLFKTRREQVYKRAGLDEKKFKTTSLDVAEAMQVADVSMRAPDEGIDVVPEKPTGVRERKSFTELVISNKEVVSEIESVLVKELGRTALVKGLNVKSILNTITQAVEKPIMKLLKKEMGNITQKKGEWAKGEEFVTQKYKDFISNEMNTILASMPLDVIKQKQKSKAWSKIFKVEKLEREAQRKVDPDTGKITYPGKGIYKIVKPPKKEFVGYFTEGGYTTLIARQKSLTQPIGKELAKIALFNIMNDTKVLETLADRTGLSSEEISSLQLVNILKNVQEVLDDTASEQRSFDVIKFSNSKPFAQNLNSSFDALSTPRQNIFMAGLDGFINAIGATKDVSWSYNIIYGDLAPPGQKKNIIKAWDYVQKSHKKLQEYLNTGKPKEVTLEEYLYESFDEQKTKEVHQKLLGLGKGSINFTDKDQVLSTVGSMESFLSNKIKENPNWTDKQIVEYAINNLGPLLTASAKVGDGSLTWKKKVIKGKDIWSLVETGKSSRTRTSLFANQGQMLDVLIKPLLKNPNDAEWRLGKADSKGKRKGKVFYKDEVVVKPRAPQNVKTYVNEVSKTGDLSAETLNKSNDYAKQNENTVFEILDFFKKEIKNPESQVTKNDLGMIFAASNGDMTAPLRAAANVDSVAKDKSTNPDDYRYEHNPPSRTMLVEMAKYINGDITSDQLRDKFNNFTVSIIPKLMDDIINVRYSDTIPIGGLDNKWKRYYNNFSYGEFPFSTTQYVKQANGTYKKVIHGKYMANAYKHNPKVKNSKLVNDSGVISYSKSNTNQEILDGARELDNSLNVARDPNASVKKIRIFDFDDTLARTKSSVLYTMPDGKKGKLTAEQFAERSVRLEAEGAKFDFSEFEKVIKGKKGPLLEVAKLIADKRGTNDVFVLTARPPEAAKAIKEFLKSVGLNIPLKNITGLADGSSKAKSQWIIEKAAEGYNDFYFADDHTGNVRAVKEVLDQIDVKSRVQQAKIKFSKDVDRMFNDIIENKTGIEWYKEYSPVKAKTEGSSKGRFKFFIPASAEDFVGLLYRTLGKGKVGDTQMAWYKKHLLDPYARAMENVSRDRIALISDFKALKKDLTGIPKNLRKKAFGGYTYENVIRIHIWNKQGMDIPGLSKKDLKEVNDFVANNLELEIFAEQLININKGDAYGKPGNAWLAGTITTDLIHTLNTTKRTKYLEEWQQNVDLMFSEKNLNKLEAAFGSKYREAIENMLIRMKTGRNRTSTGNRLENRMLDYINNSVGAVMFFNMRSAVLQTISAVNFLNWKDNNPLKAGKAFANQPQYWSDFMKLMNSDFLVDRRNGLKINVSESEIADAAKTAPNKAKGVISYLLEKGFLPTKFADSFAIASGGATFFRNRVNTYIKEGMSKVDAEAKAFEDFREIAEESQQSARPDRISQQQASGLGRVILAFANTPMQYTRIMKKATQDLINGRGDYKSNISKIVYYGAIQNVIFNALQQAVFALAWDDEEDEKTELKKKEKYFNVANSMLDSILRGTGIGGAALSTVKNLFLDVWDRSGKKRPDYADAAFKLLDFSPPIDIKISKLRQAGNNWEYNKDKIAQMGFSIDNPAYLSAALVISAVTNVPVDRLMKKYENVSSALEADQETWKRIAMMLGWPEWQLESPKEQAERRQVRKEEKAEFKKEQKTEKIEEELYKGKSQKEVDRLKKSEEVYDLKKDEQIRILKSLGLSSDEIRKLKLEEDRVNKILSMRDKDSKKIDEAIKNQATYEPSKEEKEIKRIFDLNKSEQVEILEGYDLSDADIKALKYEQDRVDKILELQED